MTQIPSLRSSLRLIFMGTPVFAERALAAILHAGFEVVAVYAQPPRPAGRGYTLTPSPVHQLAEAHGIPVFTPTSLRSIEEQEKFHSHDADIAIVAAYGLILPLPILEAPRLGCVNIHGSLLPRWRGAAPIQRALLAGDATTGISIMQMDVGLDTGPVYRKAAVPIEATTTSGELHDVLADVGAQEIVHFLADIQAGKSMIAESQPTEGVTYAHKLTHEEGILQWGLSAEEIERHMRALNPWPGTFTFFRDMRLKILKAAVVSDPAFASSRKEPGMLISSDGIVTCGEGALQLLMLQKPGGKVLAFKEFCNGTSLPVGTHFKTHATV